MIKIKDELDFHRWFKKNYNKLGFTKIKSYNKKFPDFIMLEGDKEVKVELEVLSSNFILHKHNPKKVDKVICINQDVKLKVPTIIVDNIRLTNFEDKDSYYSIKNQILKLFEKERILTTNEISKKIDVKWNTAELNLLNLTIEGKVEKIKKDGVNLWVIKS